MWLFLGLRGRKTVRETVCHTLFQDVTRGGLWIALDISEGTCCQLSQHFLISVCVFIINYSFILQKVWISSWEDIKSVKCYIFLVNMETTCTLSLLGSYQRFSELSTSLQQSCLHSNSKSLTDLRIKSVSIINVCLRSLYACNVACENIWFQPMCDNHDDGETAAIILCNTCGNLCTDCDRFLHLHRRTKTHQRQVGSVFKCPGHEKNSDAAWEPTRENGGWSWWPYLSSQLSCLLTMQWANA